MILAFIEEYLLVPRQIAANHLDNFSCGGPLGEITIWGSIAENFRGRVTCCGAGGIYIKNYKYDERLKTIQPPDFLAPSSTEVTLSRVTAPPNGFGEG